MCGIFGVRLAWLAQQGGDVDARLQRALDALGWRGRDSASVVKLGDFALGCARLAITNGKSHQPVSLRGGRLVGALNGAVTNARALWSETRPRAARRALPNDAWLPMLLVSQRGAEALDELLGHHAAVVCDAESDAWWAARDAFGEKPMFVLRERGEPVAVASTIPALRALGASFRLSRPAVQRFFRYGATGALEHEEGERQVVEEARGFGIAGPSAPSDRALPFAMALQRAVARCADCEPRLGMFLSGGVDSSCLAAELTRQGRRVRAYQFQADGEPADERELAQRVAARCGHDLARVGGGPEALDALAALTAMWGLPLGDPSVLAAHAVAVAAARDGVRVLLSGEGADELLFGYARHRAIARMPSFRLPLPGSASWSMRRFARTLRALSARHPYEALLEVTPPAFRAEVLGIGTEDDDRCAPSLAADGSQLRGGDATSRLLHAAAVDRAFYLRSDLLPKLDVATMAAQVEGRCPFLDREVAAAADAIAPLERLGKRPLRKAYADALPPEVFAQRKRGFSLPLDRWFRGELPMLDLLRDAQTRQRSHLRAAGLDRAIDLHRSGACDLGHALYLVAAFETWLRTEDARCA